MNHGDVCAELHHGGLRGPLEVLSTRPSQRDRHQGKTRGNFIQYSTVLYMQHLHMQNALLDCVQEEKNIFICTIIVHDIIHLKYIHAYNLEGNQTDLE